MPSIRDVVRTLALRDGVDAVIVLGRDGLTIDSTVKDGVDVDGLAALIPSVVAACTQLGSAASRGEFGLGAVEYAGGLAVICALTSESLLAIFVKSNVNVGSLLYELHRHRSAIASLLQ
jgi:predicted regulator of Ras-like GTPase activity (Roadblock/LC7/MglB family)